MDLNAQVLEWTTTAGPYELAEHAIASKSRLLILLSNWLDSEVKPEEENDYSTLNFWAARLLPLWAKRGVDSKYSSEVSDDSAGDSGPVDDETMVVICNRSGKENGTLHLCPSTRVILNLLTIQGLHLQDLLRCSQ